MLYGICVHYIVGTLHLNFQKRLGSFKEIIQTQTTFKDLETVQYTDKCLG